MRLIKLVMACGLTTVLVAACGIKAKPIADGSSNVLTEPGNHAQIDDPRLKHAKCLRADGFRISEYRTAGERFPAIQVGSPPAGPTIVFYPTPGIAQGMQIEGRAQAAMVIGAALVYPRLASDANLTKIEQCVKIGVTG